MKRILLISIVLVMLFAFTAQPHHAGHEEATIATLAWPLVNFVIYALIMHHLFRRLGAPALLDRAATFEQHLKRAAQVLDDAEQEVRSLRVRQKGIVEEQNALRERLSAEGALIADRLMTQAEQTAQAIKNDVSRRIARELHVATSDIKQQVIARATELAREELRSRLSDQDDYRLRQEAVKGLF